MNPSPEDPLLRSLAELPPVPLDDAAADALRRRARAALVEGRHAPRPILVRLAAVWSDTILPGVLVASGAAYAWMSMLTIERIFVR